VLSCYLFGECYAKPIEVLDLVDTLHACGVRAWAEHRFGQSNLYWYVRYRDSGVKRSIYVCAVRVERVAP